MCKQDKQFHRQCGPTTILDAHNADLFCVNTFTWMKTTTNVNKLTQSYGNGIWL